MQALGEGPRQSRRMDDRAHKILNVRQCEYSTYPILCFADSASSRRIHPLPFGLPPFGLKGKRFYVQAKRLLYSRPNLDILCRMSISKGARFIRVVSLDVWMNSCGAAAGPQFSSLNSQFCFFSAQPRDLNSLYSTLNSLISALPFSCHRI